MLKLIATKQFKKDLKKIRKRGLNLDKLEWVIVRLQNDEVLSQAYRDHALVGNYVGFRECHIEPD